MYTFAVFLFLGFALGEVHEMKSKLVASFKLEKRAVSSSMS